MKDDTAHDCQGSDLKARKRPSFSDAWLKQDWYQILDDHFFKFAMVAGNLVAWRCGSQGMKVHFGDDDTDAKGSTELFKAENGVHWSSEVRSGFSDGVFENGQDKLCENNYNGAKRWYLDISQSGDILLASLFYLSPLGLSTFLDRT